MTDTMGTIRCCTKPGHTSSDDLDFLAGCFFTVVLLFKSNPIVDRVEDHRQSFNGTRDNPLDETLTLIKLGVTGALYRSLRTTNPIENLQGTIRRITSNVRRWRNGKMIVRWVATALMEAEGRFRRIKGVSDMPRFLKALDRATEAESQDVQKIA